MKKATGIHKFFPPATTSPTKQQQQPIATNEPDELYELENQMVLRLPKEKADELNVSHPILLLLFCCISLGNALHMSGTNTRSAINKIRRRNAHGRCEI
jgi:hypothetical protein